jgi:hypothetical protein
MEFLATSPEAFVEFQKVEQERQTRIIREDGHQGRLSSSGKAPVYEA